MTSCQSMTSYGEACPHLYTSFTSCRLFARLTFGGPATGLAFGLAITVWLRYMYNNAMGEITLTIVGAYATYLVGDQLFHVSGVLAVVILGESSLSALCTLSPSCACRLVCSLYHWLFVKLTSCRRWAGKALHGAWTKQKCIHCPYKSLLTGACLPLAMAHCHRYAGCSAYDRYTSAFCLLLMPISILCR